MIEKEIANKINERLEVNLFEKSRKIKLVDARSLYCYILHKHFNLTLYEVRDVFKANGMAFDHSSVYHNVVLFEDVRNKSNDFDDILEEVITTYNPSYNLIERLKGIKDIEMINSINECVNSVLC